MFDKKDREDVNRKSPCNDVSKQWLNLDGRGQGSDRIAQKRIPDTHPVQERVHIPLLNELTALTNKQTNPKD